MKPFKGRRINGGKPVEVYRNLHTGGLSIRQEGVVVAHTDPGEEIELLLAEMVVHKAGQEKVRREGRKNVHAFIRGYISPGAKEIYSASNPLTYNPYRYDTFVNKKTEERVDHAKFVVLSENQAFYGQYRKRLPKTQLD